MNKKSFSEYIKSFDFKNLFIDLGWDNFTNTIPVAVENNSFELKGIAEKRGFVILLCSAENENNFPKSAIRKKIEHYLCKIHQEHLIIYMDKPKTRQIWQFVIHEKDKPKRVREIPYNKNQDPEGLYQRARGLLFTLDEEESITLVDVTTRFKESFGKNIETITKKFYVEFKKHHSAFLDFIEGIDDLIASKDNKNKQWYASLMLNRIMFCYFIQKRGYLNNDINYLQNKFKEVKEKAGKNKFYSFYREFLLQLFHEGLGKPEKYRKLSVELGNIPYLNGGLFDVHYLEKQFTKINIKDDAFERIFNFFDQWNWYLDSRIEATGKDINPDVIGYIFEKYINDRAAMGAYYTKVDITDYIGKNTIVPFLFDKVKKDYPKAFKPDGYIWSYLKNSGDTYIYDAVKKGINEAVTNKKEPKKIEDLNIPQNIASGLNTAKPELLERRKDWNIRTPEEFALPTEIWRETIDRWKRYFDIKSKILKGEISEINDFITYNLNIRQFVQDILENTDDPDLIRYFYKAIHSITILDPTCGSGAFLFAALNILEPLYEACIERMEQFTSETLRKYKFFHEVLAEVNSEEHPNLQYYIFKSIILNNLYGVDIMHEAVEIAKLRLFLKMVGAVDLNVRKPNYGLEPLPDIDFNIKAGNTLVGFATFNDLKNSQEGRLDFEGDFSALDEECQIVATAYKNFQDSQLLTDIGEDTHRKAKQELQERLDKLNEKMNEFLALSYGIERSKEKKRFNEWRESHQPFHWFVEFYDILSGHGGFDAVIGNPPYLDMKKFSAYELNDYKSLSCKNLYPLVIEKCESLGCSVGRKGYIVPVSSIATEGYLTLQKVISHQANIFSSYDDRPSHLFNGLDKNTLSILLLFPKSLRQENEYSTRLIRWSSEERNCLFELLSYHYSPPCKLPGCMAKIGTSIQYRIWTKIFSLGTPLNIYLRKSTQSIAYYSRKINSFLQILDFIPSVRDGKGKVRPPSEFKELNFDTNNESLAVFCLFNSSLYRWFLDVVSDGSHLNKRDIINFPFNPLDFIGAYSSISNIAQELHNSLKANSQIRVMNYQHDTLTVQCIIPKYSKVIIDQIDMLLGQYYDLTDEEIDFIINYDIKYRIGKALFGEDEEENEEKDNE